MNRFLEILEWIHATLIFSLFIPLVYALCSLTAPEGTAVFYMKCLLIAVPVVVTGVAVKRVRTLGGYILVSAGLLAAVYGLTVGVPLLVGERDFAGMPAVCYRVGMLVETVVLVGIRLADRIRRQRFLSRREMNPFELNKDSFLNRPSMGNGYFIVMYIVGIFFNAKLLCDTALFCAVVYLFLALAYTFFGTTEQYLTLNRRTKGIPRRRLYAVSGGMLCLYAALLLAAAVPSFLMADARRYTDVREWFGDVPLVPSAYESSMEFQAPTADMGGLPELLAESMGEAPEPSKFWDALFWVLGIAGVVILVWGIVMAIKRIFEDFRKELDDNGDKVEDLEKRKSDKSVTLTAREQDSETVKIKRLYKRTIRKHRKERPAAYEAPVEIEAKAGLAEDAAMQTLHVEYERVRYGR
ncbi:MAG: hypothetical protein NC337_00195 [Roseburia sp.]|nr:hypothetical protein [Roseburia sp.]